MNSAEEFQPIDGFPDEDSSNPLQPEQPEPTTLMALWPDEQAPTRTEIEAALGQVLGSPVNVVEELEAADHDVLWNMVIQIPDWSMPIIVWAETASEQAANDFSDIDVPDCSWVVGFETLLDVATPYDAFLALMRMVGSTIEDAPAILDVASFRWHFRPEIDSRILPDDATPPETMLWIIHAVSRDDEGELGSTWLHTHGLARCGLPELEMLEVPASLTGAAATLMNGFAELLLESDLPAPGHQCMIGQDVVVTLQPWQDVVGHIADDTPGGPADRDDDDSGEHTNIRAVVCDPEQRGSFKKTWVWPREAVERLARDDALLYRSQAATQRESKRARSTWDELATSFAAARRKGADHIAFFVKVGMDVDHAKDEAEPAREHVWVRVDSIDGSGAKGTLHSDPVSISRLKQGDSLTVTCEQLSDWRVHDGHSSVGPAEADALWQLVGTSQNHDA